MAHNPAGYLLRVVSYRALFSDLYLIYSGQSLSNKIYKFVDDTKLAARVKDCNGSFKLQRVIDKLIR